MMIRLSLIFLLNIIPFAFSEEIPIEFLNQMSIDSGNKLFRLHCARCHGISGEGGEGSNLASTSLRYAKDDLGFFEIIREGLPGTGMPGIRALTDDQRWKITSYIRSLNQISDVKMPGNPILGREIYNKAACSACHIISGDGIGFGPELTTIGNQRGLDYLRESIELPSIAQPTIGGRANYLTVRIKSNNTILEGIRLNEDTFSILIRDLSGKIHSFQKREVQNIEKIFSHSLMPNYMITLSKKDRYDLISYLMSLRSEV
jgi:putative heme-binding domain-containing protein|tara:strand:- start:4464 stop:5243 length:780 start_codon:yes stop_codon:yes gene_type:complete